MPNERTKGGWRIWITYYDRNRRVVGYGVHPKEYSRRDAAVRRAKKLFEDNNLAAWIVSQTDPHELWKSGDT